MNVMRPPSKSLLFGSRDYTDVSRAVGELQARRPIRIDTTGEALLVLPVEGLDDQRLIEFEDLSRPAELDLIVTQQRALRQANPNRNNLRNNPARQPGLQRQNNLPQRQNGLPQRPASPSAPGQPNRQENRQEQNRQGQIQPPPGAPRTANGPGVRQPGPPPPGLQRPGFGRPGFARPALQRRPPPKGKPEKERR